MRLDDPLAMLAAAPFLRSLDSAELEKLVSVARIRRYQPREQVWTEGDPIPGIIFNTYGLTRIFLDSDSDQQTTITTLWPGEVPPGSILQRAEWVSHAVTVSPVVMASIPAQAFYAACSQTPILAHHMFEDMTASFFRRYAWEMRLRLVPLRDRLLMLLGRMADEVGTPISDGILLDFPLTHQIAADLSWVRRDHAGRVLKGLTNEGYLVDCPRYRWLIPDRERLGSSYRLPGHGLSSVPGQPGV